MNVSSLLVTDTPLTHSPAPPAASGSLTPGFSVASITFSMNELPCWVTGNARWP
jgi:hypothetical protein